VAESRRGFRFPKPASWRKTANRTLEGVSKYKLIDAFGGEKHALLMYDLTMVTGVVLTCAKHLVIRAGKIHHDKLTLDSKKLMA
jgi:hypothetical protein